MNISNAITFFGFVLLSVVGLLSHAIVKLIVVNYGASAGWLLVGIVLVLAK